MQDDLIKEFYQLGIEDLTQIPRLHELKGDFINLECRLPNGQTARILDDNKMYYGTQVCRKNSGRCYGLAADEKQLVVYEYGNGGADAELVAWKRR